MINYFRNNFYTLLGGSLIAMMAFSTAIPNLIFGLMIFVYIFKTKCKQFSAVHNKALFFLILLLTFFTVKSVYNHYFISDFKYLSRYFIIISTCILFYGINQTTLVVSYLIFAILATLRATINAIKYVCVFHEIPFGNGIIVNKILVIERPYIGFISVIALSCLFYLWYNKPQFKKVYLLFAGYFFLFCFIIAARLSLMSILLSIIIYILFFIKKPIISRVFLILTILLVSSGSLFLYKNLSTRVFTKIGSQGFYDPRITVWSCVGKIVHSDEFNLAIGDKNYGESYSQLQKCYQSEDMDDQSRKDWFLEKNFNTHNQFFDILLAGGVIGLALFFFSITYLLKDARIGFFETTLVCSLILFLVFENVFHRQLGCYLTGIIYSLLVISQIKVILSQANIR
ncbi:MAG: O-antigen ligase family protein [Flavobacteriaceae bacterium]